MAHLSATDSDISHSLLLLRQHWKPQGKVKAESKCLLEEPPDGGTVNSAKGFPMDGWYWESRRCSRTSDPSDALDGGMKNVLKCIQRGEYVSHLQRKRKVSSVGNCTDIKDVVDDTLKS